MAELTPSEREQALLLGAWQTMVGIMTTRAADPEAADRPAVVILNSGIIHRVGANRMHVTLARTLAARGITVLRFDLSGIGDSRQRQDSLAPFDAAMADIGEVLDHLEQTRGIRRVVLVGLCSGARHALLYAANDPRVVGLGLLDLFLPRTLGYYLRFYSRRLARVASWRNVVTGKHPVWGRLRQKVLQRPTNGDRRKQSSGRDASRTLLTSAFNTVTSRGVPLVCVFTGGLEGQHNYRTQILDAFPGVRFGSLLRLEYYPDSDHTFSSARNRARLIGLLCEWCSAAAFPGEAPRPAAGTQAPGPTGGPATPASTACT